MRERLTKTEAIYGRKENSVFWLVAINAKISADSYSETTAHSAQFGDNFDFIQI